VGIKVNRTPQAETMATDDDDDRGINQEEDACSCATMLGVLSKKRKGNVVISSNCYGN